MNPSPPPIPPHFQPYTMALKGQSPFPPSAMNNHFPSPHPHFAPDGTHRFESQYTAFLPPTRSDVGLIHNTTATTPSSTVPTPPSVPSASIAPSVTTSHNMNFYTTSTTPSSASASPGRNTDDMTQHLQHVNMQLTDKVRQWEAWYMTVCQDLEARQARAQQLESQVQELQRQKAVLSARVTRWQRWAKKVNHKAAVLQKHNTNHHQQEESDEDTLLPRLQANPSKDHQDQKSKVSIKLHPRPFKKRRFQGNNALDEESNKDSSSPPASSSLSVSGTARNPKKSPRPILKVRTLEASQAATLTATRCSTPQENLATQPAPVTPSEEEAPRPSVAV